MLCYWCIKAHASYILSGPYNSYQCKVPLWLIAHSRDFEPWVLFYLQVSGT